MVTVRSELCRSFKGTGEPVITRYHLTSQSELKRQVVCGALDIAADSLGYASSEISLPEQPVNHEGAICCKRRMCPTADSPPDSCCISIENYLTTVNGQWCDGVFVIIRAHSAIYAATGGFQVVDRELVEQYFRECDPFSKTLGAYMQDKGLCEDGTNWQRGGRQAQIWSVLNGLLDNPYDITVDTLPAHLDYYQDFPKPGVLFKDISALYNVNGFVKLCLQKISVHTFNTLTHVFGIESRGFPLAALLARKLVASFHMIRKAGKLPNAVKSVEYGTEYSRDALEIAAVDTRESVVLIVDDLIATGGSIVAAAELVRQTGTVVYCFAPVFVEDLEGEAARRFEEAQIKWIKL